MSNPLLSPMGASDFICRIADKADLQPALRWILGQPDQPASDAQVLDFLRMAFRRGIDPASLWIATHNGQLIWPILPVTSPGRTMLLFVPADYRDSMQAQAARVLSEKVLAYYSSRDIQLAQLLLEPSDHRIIDLYASFGFKRLSELIYLQGTPRRNCAYPPLPAGFELRTYDSHTHDLFAAAIQQSYSESLDCPTLSSMRGIDDVFASHKAAGEFDPEKWFVMLEKGVPLGVVLVAPLPSHQTMELVYLGLIPQARHRGLGDLLFRQALAITAHSPHMQLHFAVDSFNRPALKLYYRYGMQRIGSKIAMLRDLRK
ncbi:MAG TPA: GNAT family N-acetyltransferase [Tepidisphaeraceae bacterium]|nr:GNAT family N-acetyltransferase [Tepidisphaeraceae bacterium]